MISCAFEPLQEIPEPARHLLRRIGLQAEPTRRVPSILVKPPERSPRAPTARELALILTLIQGLLLAHERGWLARDLVTQPVGLLTLALSGAPTSPELSVACGSGRPLVDEPSPALVVDRGRLEGLLLRPGETLLVGCPFAPVLLSGTGQLARALLVIDRRSGRLLDGEALSGRRWPFAAASRIVEALSEPGARGEAGLPERMLFVDGPLLELIGPELRLAGVDCRLSPEAGGLVSSALDEFLGRLSALPG